MGLLSSWCGRSFPCNSRTERKAGSPVFPIALPAPDSITASLFSPPSPRWDPLTNQPLRTPSQMINPKTISRTTTGMATAMARVLVETPPPPPPLVLRSLLVPPPPVASVVESVVALSEADAVELFVLGVDPVEVPVLDAWSWMSSPSLVAIQRRQQNIDSTQLFPARAGRQVCTHKSDPQALKQPHRPRGTARQDPGLRPGG
jgi:hypothetical protein